MTAIFPSCTHCDRPFDAHAELPNGDRACPGREGSTFDCTFAVSEEVVDFVRANLDKSSKELAQLWINRVIHKTRAQRSVAAEIDPETRSGGFPLVRVFTPEQNHRYENLIICRGHLSQILDSDPPFMLEEIPTDRAALWGHRCLMCGVDPAPGRLCGSSDCRRGLHPEWPAVYCCNACALDDL